jgi:hypothetical protein
VSGRNAGRARFDVWPTQVAAQDLGLLRSSVEEAALQAIKEFERNGCLAADHRLEGPAPVERICVRRLPRNYRMLVAFPSQEEVVILLTGPRQSRRPRKARSRESSFSQLDVYERLYKSIGLDVPVERGRKPLCCDDGRAPVDPQLVDRFIERSRQLARDERRRKVLKLTVAEPAR